MIMRDGEHQGESSSTLRHRSIITNNNTPCDDGLMNTNELISEFFSSPFNDDIKPDLTRRRRSSITLAVLQRRHVAFDFHSEDNEIRTLAVSYLWDHGHREADRDSAILGFSIARPKNQVYISRSQNIHIGPTIVVTEQPTSTEQIPLSDLLDNRLENINPRKGRKIRCSVAVFVCWSVVVSCGIIFQVAYKLSSGSQNNPRTYHELNLTEWWYICRKGWKAESPLERKYLDLPIHHVIIGHSEFNYCDDKDTCIEKVLAMQKSDKAFKFWEDIGPNFLVSGNGMIFEGRGANVEGSMLSKNNDKCITILFLGDYATNKTCLEQFDHLNDLLTELVNEGILVKNYNLLGECQISEEPVISPGPNVMDELEYMEHWNSEKTEGCIRRDVSEN